MRNIISSSSQKKKLIDSVLRGYPLPLIYLHHIKVRFAGMEFSAPAGFSDALKVGFNLLGRAGFFDRFTMCFNDRARVLTATRLFRNPH